MCVCGGVGGGVASSWLVQKKLYLQIFSDEYSYCKAIGLALLLRGEVGQVVLQVVGRGVALLRPLH